MVTEEEIEAALHLSAERKFDAALARYHEMLARAEGDVVRMKILFGIVTCSTWLGLDAIKEDAIRALKQLPDYDVSHAFIVLAEARALNDLGRAQEALDLVNESLASGVLQRDDFRDWKYEHLFIKGQCLIAVAAVPLYYIIKDFGYPDIAQTAGLSFGVILLVVRLRWSLRRHYWFWGVIILASALHAPLILAVHWPDYPIPGISLLPIAAADLFIILGAVAIVGKLAERLAPATEVIGTTDSKPSASLDK